jgi:hypothetical protein
MKIRTLLLGTAAAFAVSSGAQAADLAIAVEPVDYVKVCDAFGTGYYYIPGTDTCLKIGGYVQLDFVIQNDDTVISNDGIYLYDSTVPTAGKGGDTTYVYAGYPADGYYANWEFKTEVGVTFTAKTMSDLGPVTTFFKFLSNTDNQDSSGVFGLPKYAKLDAAWGAIGPIGFGYDNSTFDYAGEFTYDGAIRSDTKVDQLRWTYAMGTWGIMASVEDPRDRWGQTATGDMPDIIAALTGAAGNWDWKLSVGVTDRTMGTGWGVALGTTWDFGGGAKLRGIVGYSDDAASFVGGGQGTGVWWNAMLSGIVALSSNVNAAATVAYLAGPDGYDKWDAVVGLYWAATATSEIGGEVLYREDDFAEDEHWHFKARFKTYFN